MKSKKNIKSILIIAVVGIISLFFINMSLAANTAKINVETANLRETADENSKILEQFSMNQEVEIIEKQGNWYKVKSNGMTGYLRQDLLKIPNETPKNENQSNKIEENQENKNEEEPKVENQENIVSENNAKNSDEKEKKIELGKQKIAENTKLKIVPVINATDIIEVKKDEEVKVIEIINDWVCIETQNTKGWLRKEKLQSEEKTAEVTTQPVTTNTTTPEQTPTKPTVKTLYTNSKTVNLRKQASTSSGIIVALTINTPVEVISEANGWSKVKVSGKEGYISSALLSAQKKETSRSMETTRKETTADKTENSATSSKEKKVATSVPAQTTKAPVTSRKGASIVAEAKKYIGCKYRYGGTTPSGFDCSGFTSYVYRKFGINLNRTAAGQYSNGVAVTKSQLQPGDLVMFGKSGITHVAIYTGGGKIVHAATSTTGVRTDSLNSRYYSKNYVGARRIL